MAKDPADCGMALIEGNFRYFERYRSIRKGKNQGAYWVWPLAEGSRPCLVRPQNIRRFPQVKGQLRLF